MIVLLTFMDCPHSQVILELPGDFTVIASNVPVITMLPDEDPLEPGNAMTCVTCNKTQIIHTAKEMNPGCPAMKFLELSARFPRWLWSR